jgi:hypothetical protein
MDHDQIYHFHSAIRKLTACIIEQGIPEQIRDLLLYSKGVALGKQKNGVQDADIRPIVICDSIIRLIDRE